MKPDFDGFAEWLGEVYRDSTVRKTISDLRGYLERPELAHEATSPARKADYRRAYDLYQEYAAESGARKLRAEPPPLEAKKRRRKQREPSKPKAAIADEQWAALRKAVRADKSGAALVLAAMMDTAKRLGDVLRIRRTALRDALARKDGLLVIEIKGGQNLETTVDEARDTYAELYGRMELERAKNVAQMVSESRSAATHAQGSAGRLVDRKLRELAAGIVEGPIHLHRLRRTVAVRMLKAGVPLEVIQKTLGHKSVRTTEIYVSEAMPGLSAEGLAKMRRRFDR